MITEYNCEEYLLLYVDDELTTAERRTVEAFIKQHPKYALVLRALQEVKLPQEETFVFEHKKSLYKTGNEIGIDNYEEYFLLYTDNELSKEDRQRTERFVLQHPHLQSEFTLLQQTKLPPETVEYKGKEALYKDEKRRRVLPLYVTRLSVAAALSGAMVFGWQLFSHKSNHVNNSVAIHTPENNNKINNQVKVSSPQTPVLPKRQNDSQQAMAQQTAPEKKKDAVDITTLPAKAINNQSKVQQEIVIAPVHQDAQPDIAMQPTEMASQKQTSIDIASNNRPVTTASVLKPLEEVSDEEVNTPTATLSSDDNGATIQPAVYKELKPDDEAQTLYVGAFQLNKAKVNGFLKSASHLLGSRAKQNTD